MRETSLSAGLLWLRMLTGAGMAYHGYGKIFGGHMSMMIGGVEKLGFPMPHYFAWAAALSEFVGGIMLVFGFWTPVAAFFIFMTMAVAAFMQHAHDPLQAKELALAYLAGSGTLMLTGGGEWSMDFYLTQKSMKK
jgi:putative oxidoreductase